MEPQRHKVIISGGGTGGHIFPAISIANALRRLEPGIEILFVGAEGRMEMDRVPEAGYRIIGLPVAGINRKNLLKNFSVIFRLLKSLTMAKRTIKEFNPDVVVGVGGYASGPVLRQSAKLGIPILIQEQNGYAGVTNRLIAKKASVICVAYDGMDKYFPAEKIIKTGNPVRHSFDNLKEIRKEALDFFKLLEGMPVILVLGGSLGAESINRCLSAKIKEMEESGCQWLWQTGKLYFEKISRETDGKISSRISVTAFINRMDYAFAAADVIISRAGAGTISELCLVGKPAILIPSPNVAEDHQTRNALALTERNAAVMIPDEKVESELVREAVQLAADEKRRSMLSGNISGMAERDADMRIVREVLKLIRK